MDAYNLCNIHHAFAHWHHFWLSAHWKITGYNIKSEDWKLLIRLELGKIGCARFWSLWWYRCRWFFADFCNNRCILSVDRDPFRQPGVLRACCQQRGPAVPLWVVRGNPTGPTLIPGTQQQQQRSRQPQCDRRCRRRQRPEVENRHVHGRAPDPAGRMRHHRKSASEDAHEFQLNWLCRIFNQIRFFLQEVRMSLSQLWQPQWTTTGK